MLEMLSSFPIWGWITAGALLSGLLATFAYRRRTSHAPPARLDFAFDPPEQKIEEEEMVAVSSLEAEYRQRSDALKEREREIGVRRQALRDRQHESSGLETLLAAATGQERANLAAILEMVEDASPAALAEGLGGVQIQHL